MAISTENSSGNQVTPLSLAALNEAITNLDPAGSFKHISYNLSLHNTLAAEWWVFMPYGGWPIPKELPNPSPLENAILLAIPQDAPNQCCIDVLHLYDGGGDGFFADGKAPQTIVASLVSFIGGLPAGTIPVIRYLVGHLQSKPDPAADGFMKVLLKPLFEKRPNAQVFYGNFAPSHRFASPSPGAALKRLTESLTRDIGEHISHEGQDSLRASYSELVSAGLIDWATRFTQIVLPAASWNHAKIFAVNGRQLVTGGANYWNGWYNTGMSWLFDLSMKIVGDAAIDAHQFANQLWKYLSDIPKADTVSCSLLNSMGDSSKWKPATAPAFTKFPQNSGSSGALTVSRNDSWPSRWGFPVQVADGIRDFVINLLAVFAEARGGPDNPVTPAAVRVLSDDNPGFRAALSKAHINPAAWASRYIRNFPICQAQRSLRFSQQKLVMDDLADDPNYQKLVAEINTELGTNWNGYIWPFDTLSALGYALANISRNKPSGGGIQIVSSTPSIKEAYEDPVTAQEFTQKVAAIMKGMKSLGYIKPEGDISDIVAKWLAYRRVDTSSQKAQHGNHSKLIVVDDAVCYIGSDNVYPSYNEESGVWIDDASAVQSFLSKYWNGLWDFAKVGAVL